MTYTPSTPRRVKTLTSLTVLSSLWLGACGAAVPPQELVDARAAYQNAETGPAKELSPAKLDTARQALEEAEESFSGDPDSEKTKTLAYIAERKALVSASAGETEKAKRARAAHEAEYLELERSQASATKEELAQARAALERETAARKTAEAQLKATVASLAELASIKEEERGMVITLSGSVLFTTGKSELLPIAKSKLDEVAEALKGQNFKQIVIEGHTDSRGQVADNEKLSLNRATAVKNHLVSKGLDGSKIEAKGLASTRPVATNDTEEGRANNRRVELIVVPQK